MSAEAIANVIRTHQPTTGMSVASGVTCQCGYWNGEERGGVNRPPGFQGLQWHQAQELETAGFGLVADAGAKALEDAAEDLDLPGSDATGYYASEQDSGYREAERHAESWLRARAAAVRGEG